MKFQNLLGMFAVLLIALSGPSYATEYGSIPIPRAPMPPTFIPPPIITFVPSAAGTIAPRVSEPEGAESNEVTESNCGGTVELCENKGKSEGDELAKFTINQILYVDLLHGNNISYKFNKIKNNANFTNITDLGNVNLNKNINISNNNKKSNNYNININNDLIIFPQLNKIIIKHSAYKLLYKIIIDKSKGGHWQIALNDNEKILINGVFQRCEFALRVIKNRYTNAAKKSDCDDTCKAFNRAKSVEVGRYHKDLSVALERANLSPLQRLITVGDTVILTPTIPFVPSIDTTAPGAVNTIRNLEKNTTFKVPVVGVNPPAAAKDEEPVVGDNPQEAAKDVGIFDAGGNIANPPAAAKDVGIFNAGGNIANPPAAAKDVGIFNAGGNIANLPAVAVTPKVWEPEGTAFNCGESAESCQQEGGNCGSILAQKVINQIVEKKLLEAEENGKDIEKDFPFVSRNKDFFSYLYLFVEYMDDDSFEPNRLVRSSENDKSLMKSAAQSAEFSLRNIKARLSIAENNPNYDNQCQASNRSKFMEVDGFHEDLSRALIEKNILLL
jgi:hypothetical protein